MDSFLQTAEHNQRTARELIRELGVEEAWKAEGARVNLVGSLRTGLLMNHRDIDFHVYTEPLSVEKSFAAMRRIAQKPSVLRINYANGIQSEDNCLEWHVFCLDKEQREWQIDIIHIQPGSLYDGHFERVAEGILAALTPELRTVILSLKNRVPEGEYIPGIEFCRAVLDDGARTWEDFLNWRASHEGIQLLDWMPRETAPGLWPE